MSIDIHSSRRWLPRTGQTVSYGVGDDGYFQTGCPRATRFVDLGDGTVVDRATGLTWVKQPELMIPGEANVHATNQVQAARGNWAAETDYVAADLVAQGGLFYVCAQVHTSGVFADDLAAGNWRQTIWTASADNLTTPSVLTWADALARCLGTRWNASTGLLYAGHDDWRLPNVQEFASLGCRDNLNGTPAELPNLSGDQYYWTSTTMPVYTTQAFLGRLRYAGGTSTVKTNSYRAMIVRGGRINANW